MSTFALFRNFIYYYFGGGGRLGDVNINREVSTCQYVYNPLI